MSRRTDRSEHANDLHLVAKALAHHHGRTAMPIIDVEQWLSEHQHIERSSVLYVVWDRKDAAVLSHRRPELEVRVASGLVSWAYKRAGDASEIPPPRRDQGGRRRGR